MYNKVELCGMNTAKLPVLTEAEKRELLAILRLLAAGNDAAMAAYDRLAALWGITQPEKPENKTTARLSHAVLGRMILGRS